MITFLEEAQSKSENGLSFWDFSFSESEKNIKSFNGLFADKVIDEIRAGIWKYF